MAPSGGRERGWATTTDVEGRRRRSASCGRARTIEPRGASRRVVTLRTSTVRMPRGRGDKARGGRGSDRCDVAPRGGSRRRGVIGDGGEPVTRWSATAGWASRLESAGQHVGGGETHQHATLLLSCHTALRACLARRGRRGLGRGDEAAVGASPTSATVGPPARPSDGTRHSPSRRRPQPRQSWWRWSAGWRGSPRPARWPDEGQANVKETSAGSGQPRRPAEARGHGGPWPADLVILSWKHAVMRLCRHNSRYRCEGRITRGEADGRELARALGNRLRP